MSTYGSGGATYADLFGSGTATYGAFGASLPVTIIQARPRYVYFEQSAASVYEQSAATFHESTAGSITE